MSVGPLCNALSVVSDNDKYVQWIQKDKLRLISQSLDPRANSQEEVDQKRWEVSSNGVLQQQLVYHRANYRDAQRKELNEVLS